MLMRIIIDMKLFNSKKKKRNWFRKDHSFHDYMRYLESNKKIFWSNFWAGLARGVGFFIGATVVVAIGLYVLKNILVNAPFVGDFFQAMEIWIDENLNKI